MPPTPKKTLPDGSGYAPKAGDQVTAHYLAGDKPRVSQAPAKVVGIRDDGTLDLAATLMGRPVTIEGAGPLGEGRYATGWSRGAPARAAPKAAQSETSGDATAGSVGAAAGQTSGANAGPLKPTA